MTEPSPFFKLPAELRNEIYRYLLAGWHEVRAPTVLKGAFDNKSVHRNIESLDLATTKALEDSSSTTEDRRASKDDNARAHAKQDWASITRLLQVSHRISSEASAMLYSSSTFTFRLYISHLEDYRFLTFGPFRETSLARMRYVRIEVFEDGDEQAAVFEAEHILRRLARHLTSLWSLRVGFLLPDGDGEGANMLDGTYMREILACFTVARSLRFKVTQIRPQPRLGQVLPEPRFDHKRYERWACRIAEERDMMVYGVRKMRRGSSGWVVHVSKWGLWPMDWEWLKRQRVQMREELGFCTLGRLMWVHERVVEEVEVGTP
ncbi:hypothetical protein G7Y79_00004g014960 [Physcia stellaris]|nr:hypothetical protein G7Y79_00004g014960 [Physcia stellaris]